MTDKTSDSRLASIEATLLALTQTVDHFIAASVDAAKVLAEQRRLERTEWQEAVKPIGRANWPLLLSFIAVIMIIGTAVLAPMAADITKHAEELDKLRQEVGSRFEKFIELYNVEHAKLRGELTVHEALPVHPVASVQLKEIYMRLEKLEKQVEAERAVPTPRFP